MDIGMRKTRAKILKRVLNTLTIEINELKARGMHDTEELELARSAITRYCNKLWPLSLDTTRNSNTPHGAGKTEAHPARRAA